MGEYKAKNNQSKRLLLRLQWPSDETMVGEVDLDPDFLERVWKLMLICEKIKRTMHGRAKVTIEDARCHYVAIHSEGPIRYLLAMARVKEWRQLQGVWIPSDLLLGNLGQFRVTAGMRRSQTTVEPDGFWLEGSDGPNQFVSVRLGRDWVRQQLHR
jgi:hypothetical protein